MATSRSRRAGTDSDNDTRSAYQCGGLPRPERLSAWRSGGARAPSGTQSAPVWWSIVLFASLAILLSGPAFFHQWHLSSEGLVTLFGAAYDQRLFFPGSDRFMMVLPFITSWLQTPLHIGIGQFVAIVLTVSAAIALFAHTLRRELFCAFGVSVILTAVVLFGRGIYQVDLSLAEPYLVPFAILLICYTILSSMSMKPLTTSGMIVVLLILTFAAAGYNPSAPFLLLLFLGLEVLADGVARVAARRPGAHSALRELGSALAANRNFVFGIAINATAMAAALWSSGWYKDHFPQYVRSNYSVSSYINSHFSMDAIWQGFVYLVDFHARGGWLGPYVNGWLIGAALFSGFGSLGLLLARSKADPVLLVYYKRAFLLWVSAIISIIVISQNAHVQLVPNWIRGRYFTLPYYAVLLALCLTAATAWVDFGSSAAWRHRENGWLTAMMLMAFGSWVMHVIDLGRPSAAILAYNSYPPLAQQIRAAKIPAILGNYWWIWQLQYELNRNAAGKPLVTPVTIRTESFGLNSYSPVLDALRRGKSFRFTCIEEIHPPPGMAQSCRDQIAFYQSQGGFPLGAIRELGHSEMGIYKLTTYELGLAHPDDPADCTASDVLLRAKPLGTSAASPASFALAENSFVYLQQPTDRDDWTLEFAEGTKEKIVTVRRGTTLRLNLLDHHVGVVAGACRVLVTLSHQETFYPGTVQLVVR